MNVSVHISMEGDTVYKPCSGSFVEKATWRIEAFDSRESERDGVNIQERPKGPAGEKSNTELERGHGVESTEGWCTARLQEQRRQVELFHFTKQNPLD